MTVSMVEQRFARGDANADQLQDVVDEIVHQLAVPGSEVAESARAAGLEPAELADVGVEIREGEQGAEPVLTSIVVGITVTVGSKVVESLWEEVIWPRLRRRLGARALGARTVVPDNERR